MLFGYCFNSFLLPPRPAVGGTRASSTSLQAPTRHAPSRTDIDRFVVATSQSVAHRDPILYASPVDSTTANKSHHTLLWNIAGMAITAFAAIKSHSIALAAFGLDSLVEIGASTVVVWELKGTNPNRQKRALRLIGAAFLALATYILLQSTASLCLHAQPAVSDLGIIWLALTLIAMLALASGKNQIGKKLSNRVLLTEARVTLIDACLAAAVLTGLLVNSTFHWWWADPAAGLMIVAYAHKEGRHAWQQGAWQNPAPNRHGVPETHNAPTVACPSRKK